MLPSLGHPRVQAVPVPWPAVSQLLLLRWESRKLAPQKSSTTPAWPFSSAQTQPHACGYSLSMLYYCKPMQCATLRLPHSKHVSKRPHIAMMLLKCCFLAKFQTLASGWRNIASSAALEEQGTCKREPALSGDAHVQKMLTIAIIIHQRDACILPGVVPVVGVPVRAAVYVTHHYPAVPSRVLGPHLAHLCNPPQPLLSLLIYPPSWHCSVAFPEDECRHTKASLGCPQIPLGAIYSISRTPMDLHCAMA